MKRESASQSALFNPRALVALLICGVAASSILSGAQLAFFCSEAPANSSQRTLTFAERVAYQRAIEEVYWRHRIWPKERPDLKPSLDAVITQAQLEKKVADYLRNSQALENYWQAPIIPDQLQAEMERIANHTRQPGVLREIFAALRNDPFVIAECLARPVLAERLVTELNNEDRVKVTRIAWRKQPLQSWVATAETQVPVKMAAVTANYTLPVIAGPSGGCTDDTWTPTSLTNAPDGRFESHGSLDRQRNDRLGGKPRFWQPVGHRRKIIRARTVGRPRARRTRPKGGMITRQCGLAVK